MASTFAIQSQSQARATKTRSTRWFSRFRLED